MKHMEPNAFTTELAKLYEDSRKSGTGTVSVTMKRMTESRVNIAKKTMPKQDATGLTTRLELANDQYPCLVRASFKNKKISTVVAGDDLDKFHDAYTTVIKAYMDSLKKKERNKKNKKQKATTA
ncbi:predicted protein [Lichtheimia corymbifera JMRC:FSU:9682]|uniref:Signal recognition particle subunit SRP14 n=1 Tax=Lichtheimia corymbifera JMRC:FSU:9682 TaxID=1263082 RepID=A0A068SGD1_9FUNG|nr:predicted protein [Lichtheimia corymbifera JMRC:FSU:9682]